MVQRRNRPAVDESIAPSHGVSRDGQPLSYNRAPSPDLAPWIARLYVTKVDLPAGHRLDCGLFNDTAFMRIQLEGNWTAETSEGVLAHHRAALYFGPQTRRMPVSVTGSFVSLGMSMRPGASVTLVGPRLADYLDRIVLLSDLSERADQLLERLPPEGEPEDWLKVLEDGMRRRVARLGAVPPDPVTVAFEALSFTDPNASIADFARQWRVEKRTLERIIRRDFGQSPKQVLRRARALDMASHLRGVADLEEADELALRYYDQSHLIREFTEFFGMSPRQFVATPQPILTLALESRQARRLEALERIAPGDIRPWE
jgi:AraC-like DNA-binding protein